MNLLRHNETADQELLRQLPKRMRVLFALICANRLRPAYQLFCEKTGRGDPFALEDLLERLWRDLNGEHMTTEEAQLAAERAMELIPSEEEGWDWETQPYAEDAAAALAYAFRARVTGAVEEAAWAGRRAYEAANHFASSGRRSSLIAKKEDEEMILAHPVVQAELVRQKRDLMELTELTNPSSVDSRLPEIRERSEREAKLFFEASRAPDST